MSYIISNPVSNILCYSTLYCNCLQIKEWYIYNTYI